MIRFIPFDMVKAIAEQSIASWIAVARVDVTFAKYALSINGRRYFEDHFTRVVNINGSKTYFLGELPHRRLLPACNDAGFVTYYYKGMIHRKDGPAVIYNDNVGNGPSMFYYKYGKLHRDDGPAIIYATGTHVYYTNGSLHRDNDLPAIICKNNSMMYYQRDNLHRDNNMPALIKADGSVEYYQHGVKIS